ncbi:MULTISPECIES: hypothetical protein [unclassified Streptomyces]|nr:hypothetical protein [Streptomyces sp. NBC_01750]WSA99706.1 hypothetical protein OIE54_10720 [Streptomyces sp. NBC_01794]WSD35845.1 hypothetical protein OG966_30455 [Streptomyces sp. NBC_01750]
MGRPLDEAAAEPRVNGAVLSVYQVPDNTGRIAVDRAFTPRRP